MIRSFKRITLASGQMKHQAHVHWMDMLPIGGQTELFLKDCFCDTVDVRNIVRREKCEVVTADQSRSGTLSASRFCR
jgi:hypothetical protein